jgi:hypothetical protein
MRAIVEHKKERRVAKAQGEVGEGDEVDVGEAEREQVESDKEKGKIGQPKVRLSRSCLGTQKEEKGGKAQAEEVEGEGEGGAVGRAEVLDRVILCQLYRQPELTIDRHVASTFHRRHT